MFLIKNQLTNCLKTIEDHRCEDRPFKLKYFYISFKYLNMLSDRTLPLVDYYSVVRCTCGKPISGAQWNMYQRLLKEGIRDVEYNDRAVAMEITIGNPQSSEEALDFIDVGLKMKSCCRLS